MRGQSDFEDWRRRREGPRILTLVWALAAVFAAVAAITSSLGEDGRQRIAGLATDFSATMRTAAGPSPFERARQPATVQLAALEEGLPAEITRLRNRERLLALEKRALSIRLALLEGQRTELTGSISGQSRGTRGDGKSAEPALAVNISDLPSDPTEAEAKELQDPTVLVSEVAGVPAVVTAGGSDAAAQGPYALELVSAPTVEEARALWLDLKRRLPEASAGLEPRIAADEADPNRLRLLAGNFDTQTGAAQRCALMTVGGVKCRVTAREGEPLP